MKRIRQSFTAKPISVFLLFCTLSFTSKANGAGEVTIPGGTVVPIQSTEKINSQEHHAGDKITFKVSTDVMVNGQTVIKGGSMVEGTIRSIEKAKGVGRPGSMQLDLNYVKAIDGSNVSLSSCNISKEGKNRRGLALGLGLGLGLTMGLVLLACLAIKGKPAVIDAGYSINCNVMTAATVHL
jgi:hypothetical protein